MARVGADAVKTYLAFIGPYNEIGSFPWSTNGLVGVRRFLERAIVLSERIGNASTEKNIEQLLHQSIKKVGDDIESMKFNTSVSQLMILSNELGTLTQIPKKVYEIFLQLLAPFAPHLAEELWEKVGNKRSIHLSSWPVYDPRKVKAEKATIAIQVNGKVRGTFETRADAPEEEVREKAQIAVSKWLEGKTLKKVIYIKGKVINFVI